MSEDAFRLGGIEFVDSPPAFRYRALSMRVAAANNTAVCRKAASAQTVPAMVTAGLLLVLALVAAAPVRADGPAPTLRILAPLTHSKAVSDAIEPPSDRGSTAGAETTEIRAMPRGALRDDANWRRLDLPPPAAR